MKRKPLRTLVTATGVAALVLGAQTVAQAETHGGDGDTQWVQQNTSSGWCRATLEVWKTDNGLMAKGVFANDHANYDCTGWLERSSDLGLTWKRISGLHDVLSKPTGEQISSTGNYSDQGYYARVCFHLDFSGAATHCSASL